MLEFERSFDFLHQVENYGVSYASMILACGAQMGKTDAVLDIMGWEMDQRPAPLMYVGPNKEFLHKEIEPRLMDMLTGTPSLAQKLATGKRTSKFRKTVGGVPIALNWAGSATSLAGMAAKKVLVDELDRMMASVQGEGDPYTLLEARGFSFRDRLRAAISTPTLGFVDIYRCPESGLEFWRAMEAEDVQSPIWRHWQSGTMHHFAWPCHECGEFFVPRFKQLRWPENALPAEAKRNAFVECPHCGGVIEEHHKPEMNRRGVYVAPGETVARDGTKTGNPRETTTLSFWVSGLCSPMVTFGERAASYVSAKISGEQEKIQAAINVGFGECYMPGGGDVPEWQEVAKLKAPYKSRSLPDGVRVLTLTCDVQKMRLIYVIRGWGAHATSWLVEAGEIAGPTTSMDAWDQLATVLTTPIEGMPIRRAFVDSGYRPGKPYNLPVNRVYPFCRRFSRRAFPTKGRNVMDKPVSMSRQEIKARGEVHKYGLDLVLLDTDYTKGWVHERIRWPSETPGAWHLPEDVTDDYCKQIVSEARVRKPSGQPEWVQRSRDNHFLDCEAMQAGMAHWMRFDLLRPVIDDEEYEPVQEPVPPKQKRRRRSKAPAAAKPKTNDKPLASTRRAERRERIAALSKRLYGSPT